MTARAIEARGGYVSRMTERVARILELARGISEAERAELIARLRREQLENEPVDDAVGREAVRRLVELEQGGPKGMLADEYFDQLEARARAESA